MGSDDPKRPLNLDKDMPTTPRDVEAQRKLRLATPVNLEGYLRFLARFEPPSYERLRAKHGPRGDKPFELLPGTTRSRR